MSDYKTATQLKLRFPTTRGALSTEQLWDLPLNQLDTLAVELEKLGDQTVKKTFLTQKSEQNKIDKLRFDIALDILNTKKEEQEKIQKANEIKESNQKILSLIANKEDEILSSKTVEELKAMIK